MTRCWMHLTLTREYTLGNEFSRLADTLIMSMFVSFPHNVLPYAFVLWGNFPELLCSVCICDLVLNICTPTYPRASVAEWTEMHAALFCLKYQNHNIYHWYSENICTILLILNRSALMLRFVNMDVGLLISINIDIWSSPTVSAPQRRAFSINLNKL